MCGIFGQTVTLGQDVGPDVDLVVFGDESYSRHETMNGYTVVYDPGRGLFCYANVDAGRFVSTGVSIDKPPPAGTRRHLEESREVRKDKFARRFAKRFKSPETIGPVKGLLEGRQISKGRVRGLTVIVEFEDVKAAVTRDQVSAMCNDPGYSANGNLGSVRDYFLEMSSRALDYSNDVFGPITLRHKRSYYKHRLLVEEAMNLLVAQGVDLERYDSRGENIIDAINFLYAGASQYDGDLWPHNHFIELMYGNVKTCFYVLTGLGETASDLSIGTFCHENGHLLCRFPDIYDYGNRDGDFKQSSGLGDYCLMATGNHLDAGRAPAPVCAYLRYLAGWCPQVISLKEPGTYQAKHGDYATVMKYDTGITNEYFIVENRTQLGHDAHLRSSGLAVYHCDEKGSNEWQDGTATEHYQVALLQADGRADLEANVGRGDATDLFGAVSGTALSHATWPSSKQWDGAESGLLISDISAPGDIITFTVGDSASLQTDDVVTGQATPGLPIPDVSPMGVTSTISFSRAGIVRAVRVEVDITHTYIADLVLELVDPSGQRAFLHNRAGGSTDNIKRTFDTTSAPGLSSFTGLGIQGNWVLRVSDLDARDAGKLNSWKLSIDVDAATASLARGQASPRCPVPDANATDASSRPLLTGAAR